MSFCHLYTFPLQPCRVSVATRPRCNGSPDTRVAGRLDRHNYALSAVVAPYQQPVCTPASAISIKQELTIEYLVNLTLSKSVVGKLLHILIVKHERVNHQT